MLDRTNATLSRDNVDVAYKFQFSIKQFVRNTDQAADWLKVYTTFDILLLPIRDNHFEIQLESEQLH